MPPERRHDGEVITIARVTINEVDIASRSLEVEIGSDAESNGTMVEAVVVEKYVVLSLIHI